MIQQALFQAVKPQSQIKENRPYQTEAIFRITEEFRRGVDSTALIMATGAGKTFVFAQIAKEFINRTRKPVLILAHRIELVEQVREAFKSFGINTAKEQGDSFAAEFDFDAVVACTPTLKKDHRLEQFPRDFFSLIITDECHHAVCADNRKIYQYFQGAKHLGVTATPLRADRIGLKNIYQTVAFQYPIQQGIAEGYLSPIKAKQIKVEGLELEKLSVKKGDFSKEELDALLLQDGVLAQMVVPTLELADTRPTIVFAQNIAHARAVTDCFNRHAGKQVARSIDTKTDGKDVREIIAGYRRNEFQFIVNVGILCEGFDYPPTACVALFRPTKSVGLLAQMVGRGSRLFTEGGKTDCLVLDFVGVKNSVRTINVFDVLDGTMISDREHAAAQKYAEQGLTASEALEAAKREVARLEAIEIEWKALTNAKAFDIMKLFGVSSKKGFYGGAKADAFICGRLKEKGIKHVEKLEQAEAEALEQELRRRSRLGLASWKQLQTMKRNYKGEFDAQTITRQQASDIIAESYIANGKGYLVDQFKTKLGESRLGGSRL